MPFGIVACTFSFNLSRNSCIELVHASVIASKGWFYSKNIEAEYQISPAIASPPPSLFSVMPFRRLGNILSVIIFKKTFTSISTFYEKNLCVFQYIVIKFKLLCCCCLYFFFFFLVSSCLFVLLWLFRFYSCLFVLILLCGNFFCVLLCAIFFVLSLIIN